jgi:hypothetical protein
MATDPNRHPKGTPASMGGKFAAGDHDESDLLLEDPPELLDLDPDLMSELGLIELDGAELLRLADADARRIAQRRGVDAGATSSDIVMYHLNAVQNAKNNLARAHANGEVAAPSAVLVNPTGYLHHVSHGIDQRIATGEEQNSDRSALKFWRESIRQIEQERGASMSETEKNALAEKIRLEQPKGRRAKPGFHLPKGETLARANPDGTMPSLDEAATADGSRAADGQTDSRDFAEGELADQLMSDLAEGRKGAAAAARRRAWDAIAEIHDTPTVQASTVGESKAAAHRRTVAAAGGVRALAAAWGDETATAEQTEALFAPFGNNLSFDQQAAVVSSIGSLRDRADDVFDGALSGATKPRASK